jgi:uncharacterized protein (DUF2062 family)
MVFRRRERRPPWRLLREFVWPRGGWGRALGYVRHRLRRLPDSPTKIGRGVWAGVFVSFTPFYGLHFVLSALLALLMRGNVVAALIGTFINNFLTVVPISVLSLSFGYWLLGMRAEAHLLRSVGDSFSEAAGDLWHNALAPFTARTAHWDGLAEFWSRVFWPYLVGGIIPGLVAATACYALTVVLVRAYQAARRRKLQSRLAALRRPEG